MLNLREITEPVLDVVMERLATDGRVPPFLAVMIEVDPGKVALVPLPIPPELFNSPSGKAAAFELLRTVGLQPEVAGTLAITDAWTSDMTKEDQARILALPPEERRRLEDGGIDAIAAAGYGRKVEAIMALAQTRLQQLLIMQRYERRADGSFTFLPPEVFDDGDGHLVGRAKSYPDAHRA